MAWVLTAVLALALVVSLTLGMEEPPAEQWAGEHRRVHFGLGLRVHGGLMASGGAPMWMVEAEPVLILAIRVARHDELRVQLSYGGGFPDLLGGETNVSYHHAFNPRWSLGVGVFAYMGVWAIRAGIEAPLILRLGESRKHQLTLALRVHAGTFSNLPILQWTFESQRFAIGTDVALGYAFLF